MVKNTQNNQKGFTLIEVVIALSIVSILLVTLVTNQFNSTQVKDQMMQKMVADVVAKNTLDRYRLDLKQQFKEVPTPKTEQVDMAGYTFKVDTKVVAAALPGLKKIVVDVYPEKGQSSLRTLDLYVGSK